MRRDGQVIQATAQMSLKALYRVKSQDFIYRHSGKDKTVLVKNRELSARHWAGRGSGHESIAGESVSGWWSCSEWEWLHECIQVLKLRTVHSETAHSSLKGLTYIAIILSVICMDQELSSTRALWSRFYPHFIYLLTLFLLGNNWHTHNISFRCTTWWFSVCLYCKMIDIIQLINIHHHT